MSWCFENIDKLLARLTEKRGKTQIKLEMKVTLKLSLKTSIILGKQLLMILGCCTSP